MLWRSLLAGAIFFNAKVLIKRKVLMQKFVFFVFVGELPC